MNLAFTIIFLIASLGILGYAIYKAVSLVKSKITKTIDYPTEVKKLGFLTGAVTVSTILLFTFLAMNNHYPLNQGEWAELIFGSMIFGATFSVFLLTFIVHYYGKDIPEKLNKGLYISMISSAILVFFGLILLTNSFADYLSYPLVNAFSFTTGIATPGSTAGGKIAFYALFILGGALIVYFVCDHRFYKEYGKHGILESTLYVAFPAGILGARIGYVIGNWNGDVSSGIESFASRVARGEWWSIFAIWEGGLTILAGALVGIVAGVLWFKFRKKNYSLWLAMDVIVPAILIAQAVGRCGNFFNCEVYGFDVYAADWQILPKIVINNMQFSPNGVMNVAPGMIHLPLFLIEGVINLAGYFVIRYAFGEGLKKYIEPGDLAASYLIWYGLTRVLLEPLRAVDFNMGTKGYWSWFWSFFFIVGGALLICANHVVRYVIEKRKGTYIALRNSFSKGLISTLCFALPGLALVILGSFLMATNTRYELLSYNPYSNGMLLLFVGLALILLTGITVPYILEGKTISEK